VEAASDARYIRDQLMKMLHFPVFLGDALPAHMPPPRSMLLACTYTHITLSQLHSHLAQTRAT